MVEGYDAYFEQLKNRLPISYWYRYGWLYPRISRHLKGRVLDIGCGLGDMVHYRPGTVGVEVNPKAVAHCRARGLDVRPMQPDKLPFEDHSFDGLILDNVLEHLERPQKLLSEMRRLLRPHGVSVVGVPGRRGYAWDSDHKRFYDEAGLNACMAQAGFACKHLIHMPFRSSWLDANVRIYALYGVYRLASES
jgi:SAM-dependent methyltransferase